MKSSGKTQHAYSSSVTSTQSFPDPAEEDVFEGQVNPRHDARVAMPRRLPSYTASFGSRPFVNEVGREQKFTNGRAMSYSPSIRTPSETTSIPEDWQTAIGGYSEDQRSIRSRSQSPESRRRTSATHSTEGSQQGLQRQYDSQSGVNRQASSHPTRDMANQWSHRGPASATELSSSNLDKQLAYDEEIMKTPQANRRKPMIFDDTMSTVSVAPSVLQDELAELKSRIQRLEMGPQPANGAHSYMTEEQRSRPVTQESLNSLRSSTSRDFGSRVHSTSSPNHGHPLLREAIQNLKRTKIAMDLLRPVDLAVSDAVALSGMNLDRGTRVRVDGLCRALTDVCLFLRDHEHSYTQATLTRTGEGPTLAQSNGSPYSHLRGHDGDEPSLLTRSRSSRRSLAEILEAKHTSTYSNTGRSISQASHHWQETRTSPGERASKASLNIHGRQLQSAAGHYVPTHDTNRWSPRENRLQNTGALVGQRRLDGFAAGHSRAPSRASTEILERPPITRDILYQRYQRTPPRRSETQDP